MEQPNLTGENHPDDNEKGEIVRPEILFLRHVLLAEVRLLRVVCAYLPLPMQQLLHSLFLILVVEIGFQCSELIRSGYLAAGVVLYIIYASLLLVFISQGIYIMRLPRKRVVVTESGGLQKVVVSQPRNLPTAGDDDVDDDDDGGSKSDKVRATAMVVMVTAQPPPPLSDSSDGEGDRRMDYTSIPEKEKSTTPNTVTNAYHLSDSESDSEDFENLRRFLVEDDDEEESSLEGWGRPAEGEGEGEEGDWQSLLSSSTLEKYDDDDDQEEEEDDEEDEEEDEEDDDDDVDEYMKQDNDVDDDVAIADIDVDVDLEQQQQQQMKKDQKKGRKVRHAEERKFYT